MKRIRLNFWQNCELIPPILVRLLAKKSASKPLNDYEIASVACLPVDRVMLISHMTSWEFVNVQDARRFQIGCGINFCNGEQMDRVKNYMKRPTWKYLRTSPEWRSKWEPLLRRYRASLAPHENQNT